LNESKHRLNQTETDSVFSFINWAMNTVVKHNI